MISISKLLCGHDGEDEAPRDDAASEPQTRDEMHRPVVVWNTTGQCNLSSQHPNASADDGAAPGELSTAEGKRLLDDLADYGVPAVRFSGGEPLVRDDLLELVEHAADGGIRPVLSTNGTLITPEKAIAFRDAGLASADVSVSGMPARNDRVRGQEGAFDAALRGIEACLDAGIETGLRYALAEHTLPDMEGVVDLFSDAGVDRFRFHHLDAGRQIEEGGDADVSPDQRRRAVERLCDLTLASHERGRAIETLLVGNAADAAFVVEYARERFGEDAAERVYDDIRRTERDPADERVAVVDHQGNVHLAESWQDYSLGNVRDRPFGAIWEDESNPLLRALGERERFLPERCIDCQYRDICGGGSRLRALAAHDDLFAPDPQCYLRDEEIAGERAVPSD